MSGGRRERRWASWRSDCRKWSVSVIDVLRREVRSYSANSVVSVVVLGLLDHVTTNNFLVAMVVVLLPGDEVDLLEELLLVMLEFSDHLGWVVAISGF